MLRNENEELFEDRIATWIRTRFPRSCIRGEGAGTRLLDCGDPASEYAALRQGAALIPFSGWSMLLAGGPDAVDYLHRRLTQSIKTLDLGSGAHALLLGGDGRMQGQFLIWKGQDSAILATPAAYAGEAFALLDRYILMDRVELTRFWEDEPQFALAGPRAPQLLSLLMDPRPDAERLKNAWAGWFTVNLAGLPCRVFGDGRFGVPYYHLSVPPMALEALLLALANACEEISGNSAGGVAGNNAVELLRIESGLPQFGIELDERIIPLGAGLEDAISFDKGCFPGQEILARIRNLGHPARMMVRFSIDGEYSLKAGSPLMIDGAASGAVSSSITWPGAGRTAGLAFIEWECRTTQECLIQSVGDQLPAQLSAVHSIEYRNSKERESS